MYQIRHRIGLGQSVTIGAGYRLHSAKIIVSPENDLRKLIKLLYLRWQFVYFIATLKMHRPRLFNLLLARRVSDHSQS
jgi:hypothetical protein